MAKETSWNFYSCMMKTKRPTYNWQIIIKYCYFLSKCVDCEINEISWLIPSSQKWMRDNVGNTTPDHRRRVGLIQAKVYRSNRSNRWLAREAAPSEFWEEDWRGEERGEGGYPELCAERYFIKSSSFDYQHFMVNLNIEEPNYFFQDYILHIQSPISWQGCGHSVSCLHKRYFESWTKIQENWIRRKSSWLEFILWLIVGASYRPIDEAQKTPRMWFVTKPGRESDNTHHVTMVCGGGDRDFQEWDHPENIETRERERGTVNDHFRQYMELGRPQRGGGDRGEDEAKTKLIYWRGGDQMTAWPWARAVTLTSYCLR